MAKQKCIDAVRGMRTASAPWVPYAGMHCAFVINEPADKYLQDPEILAKGLVETAKKFNVKLSLIQKARDYNDEVKK